MEEAAPTSVPDSPASYGGRGDFYPSFLDPAAPKSPNSFYLPLWWQTKGKRVAFLSWQSDNPIAVLALVVIVFILLAMIIFGLIDKIGTKSLSWISDVQKTLGQALLTVVGAIVGAAASSSNKRPD
jgi:hypothetical protein